MKFLWALLTGGCRHDVTKIVQKDGELFLRCTSCAERV